MSQSETLKIDVDKFTVGDVEFFEDYVGRNLNEVLADAREGRMPGKALVAFAYLVRRKEEPDYTIEAARDVMITAFDWAGDDNAGEGGQVPTEAAAAAPPAPPS